MSTAPAGFVLHTFLGLTFVAKPPGMLAVPGRDPQAPPTVTQHLCAALGTQDPAWACHRLDKDTSGVMLVATTAAALRAASLEFEQHRVRKTYVALVGGAFTGARTVDAALGPDPGAPRAHRSKQRVHPSGAAARTLFLGLWTNGEHSLVAARPATGRTHQVRAHLAHVGYPLVGDGMYGGADGPRPLLHALFLALRALGQDLAVGAPLWEDMVAFLAERGVAVPQPGAVDAALTAMARVAVAPREHP